MNDATVTITGNVATDIRHVETDNGVHIASFRLGSTPRRWTKGRGWVDGDTSYYTVTCWRFLAQNVARSLSKGDPVVISGTVRVREWSQGDRSGVVTEVDATSVGHDLNRGISRFARVTRAREVPTEEELSARDLADGSGVEDPDPGAGTAPDDTPAREHAAA